MKPVPVEEPVVVKQHLPEVCTGCPVDLNTDAEGVQELVETALRHLESERDRRHVAIKVFKLQRQVRVLI